MAPVVQSPVGFVFCRAIDSLTIELCAIKSLSLENNVGCFMRQCRTPRLPPSIPTLAVIRLRTVVVAEAPPVPLPSPDLKDLSTSTSGTTVR